jgi:predicted PurR-regulated permease PerM
METPAGPTPSSPAPPNPPLAARADAAFSVLVVSALVLAALLYWLFSTIFAVFLLSALLAYALVPLVDWLEREGLNRTLGGLFVGLGGAGLLAFLGVLLAPVVVSELDKMPEAVGRTVEELTELWTGIRARLPEVVLSAIDRGVASVEKGARSFRPAPDAVSGYATSAAAAVTAVASALVLVPIFVFLMMRGYHNFLDALARLIPPRWRARFDARAREADLVLSGFIRGQLLVALILAVLYCLAFSLIGIPLAILVGILAGFGELIPFVGNAVALLLGSLLALAGGQPLDVLWVVGAYGLIQTLQGSFISPYIMGKRVHLSPVTVILALAVGGELLGLIGLLVAVPATALLKVAAKAAVSAYQMSGFYRRGEAT